MTAAAPVWSQGHMEIISTSVLTMPRSAKMTQPMVPQPTRASRKTSTCTGEQSSWQAGVMVKFASRSTKA